MGQQHTPRWHEIKRWLSDWRVITLASPAIGLVIIFGGIFLVKAHFGVLPDEWLASITALGIPWAIVPCVLIVIHKEVPRRGLPAITGTWAIIQGVLGILVFGGFEVWLLYALAEQLLRK